MLDQVVEEWDELGADFKQLEVDNKAYLQQLNELTSVQKKCLNHIAHQRYRIGVLTKSLRELKNKEDDSKIAELKFNIMKRKAQLYDIEQTLPKPNGTYLKIILGNVNVSILDRDEKFKYKDEYEKFKLILSIIGIVMALLNFIVRFRPLELSYIFLLVWYYCTLTIRESILKVNGSRIKGWWRLHHFLSTVAAGILLIWPDNDTWSLFRNQFMVFNIYISLVQYLQFRYQRGVLYRLKALGERHNMDITIEGFHSWMWRGLSFLLPFLFIGYCFQFYNAYTLFVLSYSMVTTWHVPVLSLMFLILFVGNTVTTISVIPSKFHERVKLQYRVMSQRLSSQLLNRETDDTDSNKQD
ncbi:transmembrane protein 120 homolog isoform X2 [Diabrotica virgifera virgifera]|uniref:Transmembrane protein 120 homolog isoform X2 n=1 Tax=Diabrotica virgifera virgifera TaxID=50390 RepID=A0A6P7G580_DIAVI|nr:transmembrane protein 120 homolog isoform X2 [Diabrotica virgifera virgifera]